MKQQPQKGHALVELALLVPMLTMLLVGVVEVGNAINAYLSVAEASREGARLVVREGSSADVEGLVQSLTDRLPESSLSTSVEYGNDDSGDQMVTVEVNYDYRFIFESLPLAPDILPNPFTLSARTTMPVP
jgi:Flp pilus assembly protein TadG